MTRGAIPAEAADSTPLLALLDDRRGERRDDGPWRVRDRALLLPLREFLGREGKGVRGRLVGAAWTLAGASDPPPRELPLLVEMLHAGSLIIDDIEDGASERRGAPALHRVHGVPLALNAGNWLYFRALAVIEQLEMTAETRLALQRACNRALLRCHEGQALDLGARTSEVRQDEVLAIVAATTRLKTGSLMALAAGLGAIAAGAPAELERALVAFGSEVGVGLQMLDDASGLVSATRRHKGHEDLRLGRLTWPWAWLARVLDGADFAELQRLSAAVERGQRDPEDLAAPMRARLGRRGSAKARGRLRGAFQRLRKRCHAHRALRLLEDDMAALEASYG
jgi:geranylgeranyl pyrophosphate synthase